MAVSTISLANDLTLKIYSNSVYDCHSPLPLDPNKRTTIDLYTRELENPISHFTIIDAHDLEIQFTNTYGVLLIPPGLEKSWLYSTAEGTDEVLKQSEVSRLLLVSLSDFFEDMEMADIQEYLSEAVTRFVQPNCFISDIPYMSNGDLTKKTMIYRVGDMIIEDVKDEDIYVRQLIFMTNFTQIQSEIRLKLVKNTDNPLFAENSPVVKGGYLIEPNYDFLTFECQRAFLISLAFNPIPILADEPSKVLILGAGGCVLPSFLFKHFENLQIITIDLNSELIDICKRFFGVPNDSRLEITIQDALEYVNNASDTYDFIMLDICVAIPGESTPPLRFIDHDFLVKLKSLLSNTGILALNLIVIDWQYKLILEALSKAFHSIYRHKCKEDNNQILYCLSTDLEDVSIIDRDMAAIERTKHWDKTMNLSGISSSIRKVELKNVIKSLVGDKPKKLKKRKNKGG